ncbi:DUF4245 domain-containing protein [Streptomyces sp. RFCAC02]|uniref:DUF4245 domain-containing protein n=1 Tax=Streptomyces sp. RFCAC02 TaxID=2499143 RepID=UPI001F0E39C0|nr:DUF4245 domain-containing protein [Streptomyces sp. RFCAC02]
MESDESQGTGAEPTAPGGTSASGPAAGDTAAGDTPPPADRRAQRARLQTVRNMVLSMVLVCVGAFGFWLVIPHDESQDPVRTVEYDVAAATAARAAPYGLLVPEGLDDDWRATAVRYDAQGEFGATWRLGFMDPADEYAALTQAAPAEGHEEEFVTSVTRGAADTGRTETVAGAEWARWEGPKYDALVRFQDDGVTVVMGTASSERLAGLAAALRVQQAGQV